MKNMKLIKVQTISGAIHKLKASYQEARRALDECEECGKEFTVTTMVSYSWETERVEKD